MHELLASHRRLPAYVERLRRQQAHIDAFEVGVGEVVVAHVDAHVCAEAHVFERVFLGDDDLGVLQG